MCIRDRPDGTPVNAVFGFTNMLARLLKDHTGSHIAVIFDAGRYTFRNRLYEAYKAHRPPAPEELIPQFILTREATEAFGVPAIELTDWEADDLIAAYAQAAEGQGARTTIVSSDKDLMQLIRPGVMMMDPLKQKPIGPAEVMEKFGVTPDKVIEVQALIGDSTDNVPGVPGIGPKGAAQLIAEFGDLESVLAAAPSMKPSKRRDALIEHADKARISRELVTLRADAPLPLPFEALVVKEPDAAHLAEWLGAQGFRSTISRLGLSAPAVAAEAPKPTVDTPHVPVSDVAFGDYASVTTVEALRVWAEGARAAGCFALDTETNGLDAMRAGLVGLSMATAPGHACYVPLRHEILAEQVPLADAIEILGPLFSDVAVLKVLQNAKFDMMVLGRAGFPPIAPVDDTMLISFAQDAGAHGHGMDELSRLHLGHTPIPYDQVTGTGRNRISFSHVPIHNATAYAAEDADVTLRLWHCLKPRPVSYTHLVAPAAASPGTIAETDGFHDPAETAGARVLLHIRGRWLAGRRRSGLLLPDGHFGRRAGTRTARGGVFDAIFHRVGRAPRTDPPRPASGQADRRTVGGSKLTFPHALRDVIRRLWRARDRARERTGRTSPPAITPPRPVVS